MVRTASSIRLLDHLVYDHDLPNAKAVRVVNYIYTGKIRARTFFEFIKRWLRLPWQKSVDPLDESIATLRAMKETGVKVNR
ncbi:MAG: hypothetical protein OK457_00660 [Thaumarchaeota archaeon]|nr:hypothetical protein [Nitrososphaerota archaeon]